MSYQEIIEEIDRMSIEERMHILHHLQAKRTWMPPSEETLARVNESAEELRRNLGTLDSKAVLQEMREARDRND